MKTMKKYGVCVVLATALLAMMLVVGCPGPDLGSNGGYTPPAGMGSVQLSFNNNVEERSILPANPTLSSFAVFELTFTLTAGVGPAPASSIDISNVANLGDPIPLNEGTYRLDVIAYVGPGKGTAAATGQVTGIGITNGINRAAVPVTLTVYDPVTATGDGTFAWNITLGTGVTSAYFDSAEMVITPIGGTAQNIDLIDPSDRWVDDLTLTAGYYYVDLELDANGTPVSLRHVLHIYQGFTSTFNYTVIKGLFGPEIVLGTASFDPWTVNPITRVEPVLEAPAGTALAGGGTITLSLDVGGGPPVPESVTVVVTNATAFDGGVVWRCNGANLAAAGAITAGSGPFTAADTTYMVTVIGTVGTTDPVEYSTYFYVAITD